MTNIFGKNRFYWVIDSDSLEQVSDALYGYALNDSNLICSDTIDHSEIKNLVLNGEGTYTFIRNDGKHIMICQDYIGSQGIYLYRHHEYYAFSNSFIALLQYVRHKYPITLNKDYADYYLVSSVCPFTFSDTLVKEIELLDRSLKITIDIQNKNYSFERIDYNENTVEVDSEKAVRLLDIWYDKWSSIIYRLLSQNAKVMADLTGGFDSRIVFSLFLRKGIDLNRIRFFSSQDNLHTHKEDYEIASKVAGMFGFQLNKTLPKRKTYNCSLEDALNISFLCKLGSHKQMYWLTTQHQEKLHSFSGTGGETIRGGHWADSEAEIIASEKKLCDKFPLGYRKDLSASVEKIVNHAYRQTEDKYAALGRTIAPEDLSLYMYRETRCRSHFGKDMYENYCAQSIKYSPLFDPILQSLTRNSSSCKDHDLLVAIIFDRYGKGILDVPFDSGRSIHAETIAYAKEINRKYPYLEVPFPVLPEPAESITGWTESHTDNPFSDNELIPRTEMNGKILELVHNNDLKYPFMSVYGKDIYNACLNAMQSRSYHPEEYCYPIISIASLVRMGISFPPQENISHMIYQTIIDPHTDSSSLLDHPYLKNYITLRTDLKNTGSADNSIEIISISDENGIISYPSWIKNDSGSGAVIQSASGHLFIHAKAIGKGMLECALRTLDVKDPDNHRIPFFIDCTGLAVNGIPMISSTTTLSHDHPFKFSRHMEDNEELTMEITWLPHDERTNTLMKVHINNTNQPADSDASQTEADHPQKTEEISAMNLKDEQSSRKEQNKLLHHLQGILKRE